MKISLVSLPYEHLTDPKIAPPLGLLYLAATVRENERYEVKVIDLNQEDDNSLDGCVNRIVNNNPDVIGISCMSPSFHLAKELSWRLREKTKALLVIGGTHVTALPYETLEKTGFHIAVIGEGEETFVELLSHLTPTGCVEKFSEIKGVGIYLKELDFHQFNGRRTVIKSLDDLPMPARDLVDVGKYTRTIMGEKATNIITSRGCMGKCIFCMQEPMWQNKIRFLSSKKVMEEIDWIRSNWGINAFLFLDDTMSMKKSRFMEICEGLRERKSIWRGWTRVDCVDKDITNAMVDSGCKMICLGVEHFDDNILKTLRKNITCEMNLEAIRTIKNSGLVARISVIVGCPGETWDSVRLMRDKIIESRPDDWLINIFVPLPGTEAFNQPDKFGIKLDDDLGDYEKCFVIGGDMESGQFMSYDNLSKEEILKMRNWLYKELIEKCPPKYYTREGIK